MERERGSSVEVRPWAADLYDATIQRMLVGTSFHYENNYYRSGSGRIATQWPDGVLLYGAMTKALRGHCLKVRAQLGACPPATAVEEETS